MPWKMDGDKAVMDGDNPIWIFGDGKEAGFDAQGTLDTLTKVTGESIARKGTIKELKEKIAPFDGIENILEFKTSADKALALVKNLDDKTMIDAGEVDKVVKQYKDQIELLKSGHEAELEKSNVLVEKSQRTTKELFIKNALEGSDFLEKKTNLSPLVAFDSFKSRFDVEEINGIQTVVGLTADGSKMVSIVKPGQLANPDEVLENIINDRPDKQRLLIGIDGGGGGQHHNHNNSNKDLSKLDPIAKLNAARQQS